MNRTVDRGYKYLCYSVSKKHTDVKSGTSWRWIIAFATDDKLNTTDWLERMKTDPNCSCATVYLNR